MNEILPLNKNTEKLTFIIAGSVDDGKSTLIGRLLYDTDQVYEDQINAIKNADCVEGELDFSLLTDGLSAEREQKITIDVAYRYFVKGQRRFVVADVPGHEQYTRNMATGASKAQVALILIDARKGVQSQSKRHLTICSLMGIQHIAVVINKMDLMNYGRDCFESIKKELESFASKLQISDIQFIPTSSLKGDMVVQRGDNLPWYQGHTVLNYLETVSIANERNLVDFRFPVQLVIRPNQDVRGYAGTVESGVIRVGEDILILPSMQKSKIKSIFIGEEERQYAFSQQSIVITLQNNVDVSRGDMVVRTNNVPDIGNGNNSMVCWMDIQALKEGKSYLLKIGTQTTRCFINSINYRLNIENLHREKTDKLDFNEIGKVKINTSAPLIFDAYKKNKSMGSFILIDEMTSNTVAGGMIISPNKKTYQPINEVSDVKQGLVLWLTGLSGSGKSTIAGRLCEILKKKNVRYEHLDGDVLRKYLTIDLDYSEEGRNRNIEIAGFVADILCRQGVIVVASFISPYVEQRKKLRDKIGNNFVEVFVNAPIDVCEERDVKGLYKKARNGEVLNFTGVNDPYETPENPDIKIDTNNLSIDESVALIVNYLKKQNFFR